MKRALLAFCIFFCLFSGYSSYAAGGGVSLPNINISMAKGSNPGETVSALRVLILFTVLSLAPAILIMMTSFTRIVVVLSFLRQALATQNMPPNQLIIGLSLFLSFFVMAPVWQDINANALTPYMEDKSIKTLPWSARKSPCACSCFIKHGKKICDYFLS